MSDVSLGLIFGIIVGLAVLFLIKFAKKKRG